LNKLEKLYNEDFLKDLLFKSVLELKNNAIEANLSENIITYLQKFLDVKKITQLQLDTIINVCDTILNNDKNNVNCLNLKAIAYYYLEKVVQALKSINSSIKISSEKFETNFIMANILFEKESYPLALKYVNKAIILNTNCISCFILKGIILHHMDNFKEATECFDKVLEKFGPNLSALAHKSLTLFRMNQLDKALDLSESVLAIDETNFVSLINKGLILSKKQDFLEAIKTFNNYASKRKDIRILTHIKNCYKKIGDLEKVKEYENEIKEMIKQKRKNAVETKKI